MEPMLVHKMPLFCYRVQIDCLPSTKSCRFVEEAGEMSSPSTKGPVFVDKFKKNCHFRILVDTDTGLSMIEVVSGAISRQSA